MFYIIGSKTSLHYWQVITVLALVHLKWPILLHYWLLLVMISYRVQHSLGYLRFGLFKVIYLFKT